MGGFGLGQYNGHGESSVSIGKVFKLCQENATTGNSSSPPRDWFSRERSRSRGCPTSSTCRAAPSDGGRRNMRPTARTRSPEAATPSRTRITRYRSSRRRTGAPQGGRDTKEIPGLLEASPSVRFEFVRTGEHGMSVKKACGALGVSRGGYHAFLNRPKSSMQTAREALEPFVEDIFYASNRRYGSRRIVVELRKIGIVANGKTAQRMMARKGLVSCRGPKKHGRGGKASDKGANVLERGILRSKCRW